MYRASVILSISLFVFLLSCNNRPRYVIPQNKMVDILYDVQLAQAIYSDHNNKLNTPEKKQALINDVLRKHDITQSQLDTSMVWYSDNIKVYMEINDTVAKRLKGSRDAINEQIRQRTIALNHDILPPLFYLNDVTPLLSFRIDSAKLKSINPAMFTWSFDVIGKSLRDTIIASAYFTYADTTIMQVDSMLTDRHYVFSKPQLSDSLLKNVSGYIHFKNAYPSNILIYNISYLDSVPVSTPDTSKKVERVKAIDRDKLQIIEKQQQSITQPLREKIVETESLR